MNLSICFQRRSQDSVTKTYEGAFLRSVEGQKGLKESTTRPCFRNKLIFSDQSFFGSILWCTFNSILLCFSQEWRTTCCDFFINKPKQKRSFFCPRTGFSEPKGLLFINCSREKFAYLLLKWLKKLRIIASLILSWRRPLLYRNQSIDLLCRSME